VGLSGINGMFELGEGTLHWRANTLMDFIMLETAAVPFTRLRICRLKNCGVRFIAWNQNVYFCSPAHRLKRAKQIKLRWWNENRKEELKKRKRIRAKKGRKRHGTRKAR